MKKILMVILISIVCLFLLTGCGERQNYDKAKEYQKSKDYEAAIEYYKKANGYEDSSDKIKECEKRLAIKNDKNAPTFSGIKEGSVVEIKCGEDFNLNEYLDKKKVTATDDVTTGDINYSISLPKNEDLYEKETGDLDTGKYGSTNCVLTAKDEAGNEGKLTFKIKFNRVKVTKKKKRPVIYDGEYGIIKLQEFTHLGENDSRGSNCYYFELFIENKSDKNLQVALTTSYINDFQVSAYHTMPAVISSGRKGVTTSMIYDTDISDGVGKISSIESNVYITDGSDDENSEDDSTFTKYIPIRFDIDAME